MSDFGKSEGSKDYSLNSREPEAISDNNFPRENISSNLQATAPEYFPLYRHQGAIRKKPHRQGQEFYNSEGYDNSRLERNVNFSNLQPNAQEFYSSNSGVTKKRYYDKNWKDRNKFTNWRSSDSSDDVNYDSQRFYRSRNIKYSWSNISQNKGYNFNSNYDRNNEEPYENINFSGGPVSSIRYEKKYNECSDNGYKNKFHYDRRNGYINKSYNQVNRHKLNERFSDYNENNFVNRLVYTENYETLERKNDHYKLYSNKANRNMCTAGQREMLIEMIDNNLLECMVCCEKIKRSDKIWSCSQCYHIIHLKCIVAWAKSSKVQDNWRCPACQNIYAEVPHQYMCYCGKIIDPKLNPNIIAHGCDNMCLKKGKYCDHKCNLLCHPGPCPECNTMVSKPCGCELTQQVVKCCSDIKIVCDSICNKVLNCGIHKCTAICHIGSCSPCAESISQECHCGKTGRKVLCDEENVGKTTFICENICDKLLSCGNHNCQKQCHSGLCSPCETDVNLIKYCYCGKTLLKTPRFSCLDPIPFCDNVCGKLLICGPQSKTHICKEKCHKGKCPPCPLTTVIRCCCGHMDKEIFCQKLTIKANARCEKKCTKKRLCGKHTCKQKCCIEIEHLCPLPCNKLLTCGLHKCELTCHSGRCPPCMETSFEELYCACKASVLYPPISCGTKLPACERPCSKARPCGHPPNHECHPGVCPPCFLLTKQWCYGKHEQRAAISCQQNSFSCGLPCGKPMPCGRHKCSKPCHADKCPVPCIQPCTVPRLLCGHPCSKPCHGPPCPESNCKFMVPVTCLCGLQKCTKICMDLTEEFRNIEMAQLKDKMSNLLYNQSVDLSDIAIKKPSVLKILDCNDECKVVERNRRLAIGLQIQNPDLSQKLTPRYSDFLKQWAKKDSKFCQRIHDKLTELVQLAKQSKQKSRSYSFESMNRDKRHFIHEYCEHFGVESAAYDAEPNRNVVATAVKDKSWLPSMSLLEVLQRENGQRKVPGPVLGYSTPHQSETVSLRLLTSVKKID